MRLRVLLEPLHGASYDQILALARATEESGFDAFFRSDHYQGIDPDDTGYRPTDSWTTLAGLAVQTERVRLGTLMTASTYRRPGPLAITVATVDAMSGGRAELGIGAAWIEQEHRYLGIPFPSLGERFDRLGEQLEIITGLWATPPGERFSFHGQHYRLEECASVPRPARRPPVIIGGAGPRRTPALAARFADEFNSGMPDGLAARFANFRRICEQSGRDPAGVRLSTTLPVCCGPTRAAAARRAAALGEAGARMLAMGVTGTPGDVLGRLAELRAAGANTVYFHLYDVTDLEPRPAPRPRGPAAGHKHLVPNGPGFSPSRRAGAREQRERHALHARLAADPHLQRHAAPDLPVGEGKALGVETGHVRAGTVGGGGHAVPRLRVVDHDVPPGRRVDRDRHRRSPGHEERDLVTAVLAKAGGIPGGHRLPADDDQRPDGQVTRLRHRRHRAAGEGFLGAGKDLRIARAPGRPRGP